MRETSPEEKVLVVEDVAELRLALTTTLERAGYEVRAVADGEEALRAFHAFQPDLALLDILLPGKSGIEVCERIREMSAVPVVIFSAVADEDEKLVAFEKGADDYVVKGTGLRELVARINAVLRRARVASEGGAQATYSDNAVTIDFARQLTWVRGEPVDLTPLEFKLFATLVKLENHPLASDELAQRIWGPVYDPKLVGWHIQRIREKIEEDARNPRLVVNRRGFGYVYRRPDRTQDGDARPADVLRKGHRGTTENGQCT